MNPLDKAQALGDHLIADHGWDERDIQKCWDLAAHHAEYHPEGEHEVDSRQP